MKHLILVFSLIFSVCVFQAIAGSPETVVSESPLNGIFVTFFALAAFIPVAVQFLRKLILPYAGGIAVQIFSWLVGVCITLAGWALNLGFLDGLSIWIALLYGAGASLAANGVYDTGLVNAVINVILKLFGVKRA